MNSIFIQPGVGSFSSGGGFSPTGPTTAPDGTLALPTYSFSSEPTLGFYRAGSGAIAATGQFNLQAASALYFMTRGYFDTSSLGNFRLRDNTLAFGSILKVDALPTIASGFGTSPSIIAGSTPLAGAVNVGTGGIATSGVIDFNGTAFPAAPFIVATCNNQSPTALRVFVTATQMTIVGAGAFTSGERISWIAISPK